MAISATPMKVARVSAGLSIQELAAQCDRPYKTVWKLEQGEHVRDRSVARAVWRVLHVERGQPIELLDVIDPEGREFVESFSGQLEAS